MDPESYEKVVLRYKLVLWLVKGKYCKEWNGDTVTCVVSDGRDKEYHKWQQSIAGIGELVRRVADEGDTVLDPFMGSGTTCIAALRMRRRFVGIELDSVALEKAKHRIHNVP